MSFIKSVGVVSSCTMISRVFGFLRDLLIARFVGATWLADAVFTALRIPNFLRRFFGEGAFSVSFIPVFNEIKTTKGNEDALYFCRNILGRMIIALTVTSALFIIFMPEVIKLTAFGFTKNPEKFAMTVELARISFPYLFFISISAMFGGVLNSLNKFVYFAAMPIVLNLTNIAFMVFLPSYFKTSAHNLCYSTIVGGMFQLILMFYGCKKAGYIIFPILPKPQAEIKSFKSQLILASFAGGIVQINILIDMLFASSFLGAVSFFYYADRIYQLPLSIIGTTVATVTLPLLSRLSSSKEAFAAADLQQKSLLLCLLFALPAAVGLAICSEEIVSGLFVGDKFTISDSIQVSKILTIYSAALVINILVKNYITILFSLKKTKIVTRIAIICLAANSIADFILVKYVGFIGIAYAAIASGLTNLILTVKSVNDIGMLDIKPECKKRIVQLVFCAMLMGVTLVLLQNLLSSNNHLSHLVRLVMLMLCGILTYALALLIMFGKKAKDIFGTRTCAEHC